MNETIKTIIETGGLASVLAVTLYGIWRAGCWLGADFVVPLRDRMILHIDRLDAATKAMMELIKGQGELIARQNSVLHGMDKMIHDTDSSTTSNTEVLDRIDKNVSELREGFDEVQSPSTRFFSEAHSQHQDPERHKGSR